MARTQFHSNLVTGKPPRLAAKSSSAQKSLNASYSASKFTKQPSPARTGPPGRAAGEGIVEYEKTPNKAMDGSSHKAKQNQFNKQKSIMKN